MNKITTLIILTIGLIISLSIGYFYSQKSASLGQRPTTKILISQFVEHPALDQTTKGIIEALAAQGYVANSTADIRVESAQANAALAAQIASKFVNQQPSIVVGVATVSAQSFSKYAILGKVKLVFSSVTDPLGASLVKSLEQPQNNTSGVSNFVPLEPQLELFRKLKPSLQRLGFLYNPGELNSISLIKKLEVLCPQYGFSLVTQAVNKTADVPQSAIKLAQNSDAIFVSNDNTALSALASVIKAGYDAKIPVFVSDTDAVALGAVLALGPNQYQVGVQTGNMIARILKGADLNNQPVEFPNKTELYLNLKAAMHCNIVVPPDILQSATKVIDGKDNTP